MSDKYLKCSNYKDFTLMEIMTSELDLMKSPGVLKLIKNELADLEYPDTILDLNNLSYIDSTGLGILVATKNLMDKNHKEIVISCGSRKILQVFEIAKIDKFFKVFDKREDAVAYIEGKHSKGVQ
jgi:anti-sigma B factor antagonist